MISSEKVNELSKSKIYDLSHELKRDIPVHPSHPPFLFHYITYHSVTTSNYKVTGAADDMWILGGHIGTHIDAIGHVSRNGKIHGGLDAAAHESAEGLSKHSIDQLPIIFRKGILLDIAGYKKVDRLPPSYEITVDDIVGCLHGQDVTINKGDVVLVRTGYDQLYFSDAETYLNDCPGVGPEAALFFVKHGISVTGSDTVIYEPTPYKDPNDRIPVHKILLADHGIPIIEHLDLQALAADRIYEFLFVTSPLKVKGGTGSPIRPFAVMIE